MSVILQFAIFPTDRGSSVSEYVGKAIEAVRSSGYPYQLTPMSTIIETDTLEEAFAVVGKANDAIAPYSERVYLTISIDIRNGKGDRMSQKISSIRQKIGDVNCK